MKRAMKILHELGAIGLTGALATQLILVATAPAESPAEYAAVRASIAAVSKWLLVPSLGIALVSGLLAIALHRPFGEAGWVWAKAALGLLMFEWTLTSIDGSAQQAAALSARIAAGQLAPAALADVLRREWGSLWILFALAIAQTVLGVWRPRMRRRRGSAGQHAG